MTADNSDHQIGDHTGSDIALSQTRDVYTCIGEGEIGGKARGLVWVQKVLGEHLEGEAHSAFAVEIPWFTVVASDWFDAFMERNNLYDIALSDTRDRHLISAFQKAELPNELTERLRDLVEGVNSPLAVRSSSLMEDAMQQPFAGVYATKMVPNNQFSVEARLRTLVDSIKFVYASTFSREAKSYRQAMGHAHRDEKMAVIIQEIVGQRRGDRFYPTVSGVARSYNFYALGHARPEDGVACLALGLGKTIVDGGRSWTFCPAHPRAKPPFGSTKEFLNQTQTRFWSVNMGKPPRYDPIQETEYLFEGDLRHAEEDDALREIASTYDSQSDRITLGIGCRGPRVLDFAPLLELNRFPIAGLIQELLSTCEKALGNPVEIEFALDFDNGGSGRARFGFLQVRPMFVSRDSVDVSDREFRADNVLVASEEVLGNGCLDSIRDVVYVKPDAFSAKDTWLIASELEEMNRRLLESDRQYLLVVFGRLGTSDPWLGIPANWGQVSGAKVVVETSTSGMNVDMSQGSHFFHNLTCLRILYFSAHDTEKYPIDWGWLQNQRCLGESQYVRHVELDQPLRVKVDGKNCRGVISYERTD